MSALTRPSPVSTARPKGEVRAERFRFRTAEEIALQTPTASVFVAACYVALGVITEIVGKAKVGGKSTFLAHLVAAIVAGKPFLGQATSRSAVVWLTEERSSTFVEVLKRAGLTTCCDVHVLHWHETDGAAFAAVVEAAVGKCRDVGAKVLIIDTVSQFAGLAGDSENNAGDALVALRPLQRAAAAGLSVIAVRHERKGGGDVGSPDEGPAPSLAASTSTSPFVGQKVRLGRPCAS